MASADDDAANARTNLRLPARASADGCESRIRPDKFLRLRRRECNPRFAEVGMSHLGNIQQPTSNNQHPMVSRIGAHWMLDVGCWMLDVFEFRGGSRE